MEQNVIVQNMTAEAIGKLKEIDAEIESRLVANGKSESAHSDALFKYRLEEIKQKAKARIVEDRSNWFTVA